MKELLLLCLIFCQVFTSNLFAQKTFTKNFKSELSQFENIQADTPFTQTENTSEKALFSEATFLTLDSDYLKRKIKDAPEKFKLELNTEREETINLLLDLNEDYLDGIKIRMASGKPAPSIKKNLYYWGMVEGVENSIVSLLVSQDEIMAVLSINGKTFNLGKVDNKEYYVLYNKDELKNPPAVDCFADDLVDHIQDENNFDDKSNRNPDNCVNMYLEVDNDIYLNKGPSTVDYITGVFSQVSLLYAQESINLGINELVIWDTSDPYTGPTTSDYLSQFRNAVGSSFNGDLAHLVGYNGSGGIAYINVLCSPNYGHGYSGISSGYNNVPAYSWTVEVLTHEIGHNLGSTHTHSCAWNGNNTQIDDCGNIYLANNNGSVGSCYDASNQIVPAKGTIMSYCHLIGGIGIDLNLGFGPQPGDLIRDRVYNSTCLSSCGTECEVGTPCNDFNDCTINDSYDDNCNCTGTIQDSDGDGVCDAEDICAGDDTVDVDNDSIPDDCDDCIGVSMSFSPAELTHSGSGESSSNLNFPTLTEGVTFSVTNLKSKLNGSPNSRYNDLVTITYVNANGSEITYGSYTGNVHTKVDVSIPGLVASIEVTLSDAYDGNSSTSQKVTISNAISCPTDECPDSDGDGVCDSDDLCEGFDDSIDFNGNGIPDDCESNCAPQSSSFDSSTLNHSGTGSSSTSVNFPENTQEVTFTINNIGSKVNGNPSNRYIDFVNVSYVDETGANINYGDFSGANYNSVDVNIPGNVQSITLTLSDDYDGNANNIDVSLSEISYCISLDNSFMLDTESKVSVYPNPFDDVLHIKVISYLQTGNILTVYDSNGRLIVPETRYESNSIRLEPSELKGGGIYIIKIATSDGKIHYKKVVAID